MGTRHYDIIGQRHTLKERCAQSYADNVGGDSCLKRKA